MNNSPVVSTLWLAEHLDSPDLILLDVSMDKVIGKEPLLYDEPVYIPNTVALSLERELLDVDSALANTFPSVEQFNKLMVTLGLNKFSMVVVYDNQGIYSSPRAWWIFKTMGIDNVFMLDGGLPQWLDERRNTCNNTISALGNGNIKAVLNHTMLTAAPQVLAATGCDNTHIVDARSSTRFSGHTKEPRAGLRAGHIPNSLNLPFAKVLDGHRFKSAQQLSDIFHQLGHHNEQQLIASCGSGITACIILSAAAIAGFNHLSLYDGSWAQWGADNHYPVANAD